MEIRLDHISITDEDAHGDNPIYVAYKLLVLANNAKRRDKEFNLRPSDIKRLLNTKRCYYTGEKLTGANRSIDRLDNDKGYVKGNVVMCTTRINKAKGDMTMKELEQVWRKVSKRVNN